jgi:hypothetical protein
MSADRRALRADDEGHDRPHLKSVSSAVRHFQGHPAGDFTAGLNRKRRRAALHRSAQDASHHFAAPRNLSLSG